ncbi:DNA primase/helicase [Leptolyngbya phage Lsp-JY17]
MSTGNLALPPGELVEWESRGIGEDIMREAGVFSPYVEGSEVIREALVFPYYDLSTSKLVGFKLRDLEAESRRGTKVCYTTGKLGLFAIKRKSDTVVITEGEPDVLTLASVYRKYTVVGLPGSSTTKLVRENLTWLRQHKHIYLCLDSDEPGQLATEELISMLPGYKTYKVNLARKDANEYLVAGDVLSLQKAFSSAERVGVSVLTDDNEATVNENEVDEVSYDTGFASLNAMLGGGLHVTELCGLVGHTGRGKSQFAAQVAYNLAEHNEDLKMLYICTEMTHRQMVRRFSQIHLGRRFNGNVPVTKAERQAANSYIYRRIRFNRFELTDPNEFYDACVQAILEDGVRVIFIDVVNDLHGFNADWASAADTVQLLKKLAEGDERENIPPTAVVMVCHTSGRDDELSLDKIRGGSAIRQRITCAVGLRGEVQHTERELLQLKQSRNFSIGVVDTAVVQFNTETTRYSEVTTLDAKVNTDEDERSKLRLDHRSFDTPSLSSYGLSPRVFNLRPRTEVQDVQGTGGSTDLDRPSEETGQASVSEVHARLRDTVSEEVHLPRGEGSSEPSGRYEDADDTETVPSEPSGDDADVLDTQDVSGSDEQADMGRPAVELAREYAAKNHTTVPDWWQSHGLKRTEQATVVESDRPSELVSDEPVPVPSSVHDESGQPPASKPRRGSLRRRTT